MDSTQQFGNVRTQMRNKFEGFWKVLKHFGAPLRFPYRAKAEVNRMSGPERQVDGRDR